MTPDHPDREQGRWAVYRAVDGWWVSSPPMNHRAGLGPRRFAAHWEAMVDADTRARMPTMPRDTQRTGA